MIEAIRHCKDNCMNEMGQVTKSGTNGKSTEFKFHYHPIFIQVSFPFDITVKKYN